MPQGPTFAEWVPVVSAGSSIVAAVVAGFFATRARSAESREQRVFELEKRLASHKAEVYEPMMEFFRRLFDQAVQRDGRPLPPMSEAEMLETISRFSTWIQIYGSDGAVLAFNRFMQTSYTNPPPQVLMRFFGDLVLAARRDLGQAGTSVSLIDLMGIRIKDVYGDEYRGVFSMSEDELYRKYDWTPPWRP